ncbi:hypothetical protein Bca101_007965 [Brassica carinata]
MPTITTSSYSAKLGAVPAIASALSNAECNNNNSVLVQSAAALGSFSCGFEAGVQAVLDAGVFPHLLRLLTNPNEKSSLLAEKEDLQQLAYEANAVETIVDILKTECELQPKRLQGLFQSLAELSSKLEDCRCTFLSLQVAVLGALSNIVLDFSSPNKSTFIEYGGIKQLIELSKSMDANTRCSALRALMNLIGKESSNPKPYESSYMLSNNNKVKHIAPSDPEPPVQEQALALLCNLVDGCINSIEFVYDEDGLILDTVGRQLRKAPQAQMAIQSYESQLRFATVWTIINLISPSSPGALDRHVKLRSAGIILQLKSMVNDPCLDV